MKAVNNFLSTEVHIVPQWLKRKFPEALFYADIDGNRLIFTECNYQQMSEVPEGHRYMHYEIEGKVYTTFWTSIEPEPVEELRQMDIFDFIGGN